MAGEQPREGWWKRINSPLSDHGANLVGSLGLLAFGLSGFIDAADGRSFSVLKVIAVTLGASALASVVWMRIRGGNTSSGKTKERRKPSAGDRTT